MRSNRDTVVLRRVRHLSPPIPSAHILQVRAPEDVRQDSVMVAHPLCR
jgi:hypothetical protein